MKLKLKHLAPYLPYGLKGLEYGGSIIHKLQSLDFYNDKFVWRNTNDVMKSRIDCKPILRPLSDLTKEIEHNREKFVPTNILVKYVELQTYEGYTGMSFLSVGNDRNDYGRDYDLKDIYSVIEKLFEWHFDVFGLIEKGLAIDINTIKTN